LAKSSISGFIQATSAVRKTILQRWLDAIWTPGGSKLCSDPQYQKEFMEPTAKRAAAFVYFLVSGEPALRIGGRKRKQPKAPAVTFAQRPFGACNVKLPCWNGMIVARYVALPVLQRTGICAAGAALLGPRSHGSALARLHARRPLALRSRCSRLPAAIGAAESAQIPTDSPQPTPAGPAAAGPRPRPRDSASGVRSLHLLGLSRRCSGTRFLVPQQLRDLHE
jgi:hypothetical protein